jgi:hypothetical protein
MDSGQAGIRRWMCVSALAGTISAPPAGRAGGMGASQWLRSALSFLLAIAVLAIALPVAFGSGAKGAGVDPIEVYSSGSLLSPATSGTAQLSVSGLVPGQSRSALVRVGNPGSAALFSLSSQIADRAGGVALSSVLLLKIEAAGSGKTLFNGSLAQTHRLALGRFAAGAQHGYRFTVTLPSSAGNEVEGSSINAALAWSAS